MPSDWKENAIKRNDFRGGKTDIDEDYVPSRGGKRKKKKKKPFTVQYKYTGKRDDLHRISWGKTWNTWGKYAKEEDALKAIESKKNDDFWGKKFEFRIKGKKGNV